MNFIVLLFVIIGLFTCQCLCNYDLRLTALRPRGIKACVKFENGIRLIKFQAYGRNVESSQYNNEFGGRATQILGEYWCYLNYVPILSIDDSIVYWFSVKKQGRGFWFSKMIFKNITEADFNNQFEGDDLTSHIRPAAKPTSAPVPIIENDESQTLRRHPTFIQTTAPPLNTNTNLVTTAEQSNIPEISIDTPQIMVPGQGAFTGPAPKHDAKFEAQEKSFGEVIAKPLDEVDKCIPTRSIHNCKSNTSTEDSIERIYQPDMDVVPEPHLPTLNKTKENGVDELYTQKSGVVNTPNNCKERPCNTNFYDQPKQNVNEFEKSLREHNINKTCEDLLSSEKKFSKVLMNSYQDAVIKANAIEYELIESQKETKLLSAMLNESLSMIHSKSGNSTNKLVLKSSIFLTDYGGILHEVIGLLLNIDSENYTILEIENIGNNMVAFELRSYAEKINIYLTGRIQLPGTNFQIFDYDATDRNIKQMK